MLLNVKLKGRETTPGVLSVTNSDVTFSCYDLLANSLILVTRPN